MLFESHDWLCDIYVTKLNKSDPNIFQNSSAVIGSLGGLAEVLQTFHSPVSLNETLF